MTPDLSVLVGECAGDVGGMFGFASRVITSQLVCTSPNRGKESRVLGSFAKDRCFQETLTKYVRAWSLYYYGNKFPETKGKALRREGHS